MHLARRLRRRSTNLGRRLTGGFKALHRHLALRLGLADFGCRPRRLGPTNRLHGHRSGSLALEAALRPRHLTGLFGRIVAADFPGLELARTGRRHFTAQVAFIRGASPDIPLDVARIGAIRIRPLYRW